LHIPGEKRLLSRASLVGFERECVAADLARAKQVQSFPRLLCVARSAYDGTLMRGHIRLKSTAFTPMAKFR